MPCGLFIFKSILVATYFRFEIRDMNFGRYARHVDEIYVTRVLKTIFYLFHSHIHDWRNQRN